MAFDPPSVYRAEVHVGNWYETRRLQDDNLNKFKAMNDSGELLVKKTDLLWKNFFKKTDLEPAGTTIKFGSIVQLMPAQMKVCASESNVRSALSILANAEDVANCQSLSDKCQMTIAQSYRACNRNSFRIISTDFRDRTNDAVGYGQHFRLECLQSSEDTLCLYTAPRAVNLIPIVKARHEIFKCGEVNLALGLIQKKNCGVGKFIPAAYTYWMCQHLDPKERYFSLDSPVSTDCPLIITHVPTNRNLAAENGVIPTMFGSEFLVSVQNYKDAHKRELWQNIWMINNGYMQSC